MLSGIGAFVYIDGADQRAQDKAKLVSVFVASGSIGKGTSGRDIAAKNLYEQKAINEGAKPPGAINDINELEGKVAVASIPAGVPLVAAMFDAPGNTGGALDISKGKQAISVQVAANAGVAGFVQVGDHVNIIAMPKLKPTADSQNDPNYPEQIATYLVQKIKVLAIGSTTTPAASAESQASTSGQILFTFEADPMDAQRIALAATSYPIYLTLVPPKFEPGPQSDVAGVVQRPVTAPAEPQGEPLIRRYN